MAFNNCIRNNYFFFNTFKAITKHISPVGINITNSVIDGKYLVLLGKPNNILQGYDKLHLKLNL